jgi:hypothetical protein
LIAIPLSDGAPYLGHSSLDLQGSVWIIPTKKKVIFFLEAGLCHRVFNIKP